MKIKARYSGKCARCGDPIKVGDEVEYDSECKSVMHPECAIDAEEASPIKPVQAGTTARFKPAEKCYVCDAPNAANKLKFCTLCDQCAENVYYELKKARGV